MKALKAPQTETLGLEATIKKRIRLVRKSRYIIPRALCSNSSCQDIENRTNKSSST